MSRSGYSDDCDDQWALIRWRGAVAASIRGKRGQKLLTDLAEAMDAMPEKRLIATALKTEAGYCALGVVGEKRGIALDQIDPYDSEIVASELDIAEPLAKEIAALNDDDYRWNEETPEARWTRMREWVGKQLKAL